LWQVQHGGSLYVRTPNEQELIIVGVASRVRDQSCTKPYRLRAGGVAQYTNTITYTDWIEERIF
jgi:hypothetical protein